MPATAVILAAGLGTRMKSALPKACHPIAGQPMLRHLIDSASAVFERIVVVIGPDMPQLAAIAAPHPVVVQHERLGTAHAALQAAGAFGDGDVAVLYADNPLITPETLRRLRERRGRGDVGLALVAMRPDDPGRYGRVIGEGEFVERVVEWADATAAERAVGLCNAGVICGPAARMAAWLRAVRNDNAKGEYYLTDVVALARAEGARVAAVEAPYEELRGINSRAELAAAEAVVQTRLRAAAMAAGVTMTAPETVFLSTDTRFAPDVTVGPNVVFGLGVAVESGAEIHAFSHLSGCRVGPGAIVGPFARLRAAAMAAGVTMTAPETVFLSTDTRFAPDVTVGPNVVFGLGVVVESGAEIHAFSHLSGCRVGPGAIVGPFARLRPGADVGAGAHVGNFVELKNTVLGDGAKANHLSYLGDAEIGARTNVGAGTITCNYDGFTKHRTSIGAGVFIGSDSVLVAPVRIGDGAFIAAGSVITESVEADAMAFGRARQESRPGRAAAFREAAAKREQR